MENYTLNYINSVNEAIKLIDAKQMSRVLNRLDETRIDRGRIFVFGNGGSSALANHFACDLGKNVSAQEEMRFSITSLCDNMGSITAYANDQGYENVFSEQLKNFRLCEKDVLIGISSSGNSPNIVKAVHYGKSKGCTIIGLSGFNGGKLKELSDMGIHIENGEYEKVEDVHSVVLHIIVSYFKKMELL